jgi:hypothetical protein
LRPASSTTCWTACLWCCQHHGGCHLSELQGP